eukprot:TRINITY_DN9270_c0_g2_i4.p2 TRINITY_DN9270_c0_g2~~TRINITY_DN9270_c0_g2_i4.p2  ORF type:complete len:106 (+),score=19.22 TRINITY_DN9270_c0_g2_i4:346-663(+)
MKAQIPLEMLCKNSPSEFAAYLKYCRCLRFEESPDYAHLRRMLQDAFRREGYKCDFIFDWMILYTQSKVKDVDFGSQCIDDCDSEGEERKNENSQMTVLSLPSPA